MKWAFLEHLLKGRIVAKFNQMAKMNPMQGCCTVKPSVSLALWIPCGSPHFHNCQKHPPILLPALSTYFSFISTGFFLFFQWRNRQTHTLQKKKN